MESAFVPPTAESLDALDPETRMSYLGNALYPRIAALVGTDLAGKVTGMVKGVRA